MEEFQNKEEDPKIDLNENMEFCENTDANELGDSYENLPYSEFSALYDLFMDNVPYEKWRDFILSKLKEHGIDKGILLDLGCGTGTLTFLMAECGYDMIGVDGSMEMLGTAMEKREQLERPDVLLLCQDMCELDLFGTIHGAYSSLDTLNYLLETEDVIETLSRINLFLEPGGIFIFDFNTRYKYESVMGDTVIAENREDASFIWENYFDRDSCINESELTFFVKEKEGKRYEKFQELHEQRGYSNDEIVECINRSGLEFLEMIDADHMGEITEKSQRIFVICREKGKNR